MCRWMITLLLQSIPELILKQLLHPTTLPSAAGYDNGTYPQAKKVIFGVNLTF